MAVIRRKPRNVQLTQVSQLTELAKEKPVLVDFWSRGCPACRAMDGIVSELAEEFEGSAHVVKVNLTDMPESIQAFRLQGTPTFLVMTAKEDARKPTARFRASGLVKKEILAKALISAGAETPDR